MPSKPTITRINDNGTEYNISLNSEVKAEILDTIGNATEELAGFLSAEDKQHLDSLYEIFQDVEPDDIVNTLLDIINIFDGYPESQTIVSKLSEITTNLSSHISNTDNPHNVTKAQVGLGDVDNKSEATIKSDFTGIIANGNSGFVLGKDVYSHTSNQNNPHSVTKAQIGLGNVDNTSDANKPISTATQTALDTKLNKLTTTGTYVYTHNGNTQGEVVYTSAPDIANSIVQRGNDKQINVPQTPTENYHAASKKYIDDELATKQNSLEAQTAYSAKGSSYKVPQITTNTLGQVTLIEEKDISTAAITDTAGSESISVSDENTTKTLNVVTRDTAQTIDGGKTFTNFTVSGSAANAPQLKLTGNSGYGGITAITKGNTGGNNYTLTLPNQNSTIATIDDVPTKATDVNEYGNQYVNPKQVRQFQQTFGIAPDLLHNINGHDLSNTYNTTNITVGNYSAVKIRNVSDNSNLDFNEAHNYMRKLTGSEYTPIYGDGTVPQFSYIVDGTGKFYKAQYDSTNGLLLYPVSQLALNSTVVHNTGDENIAGKKTFTNATTLFGVQTGTPAEQSISIGNATSGLIKLAHQDGTSTLTTQTQNSTYTLTLPNQTSTLATLDDITGGSGSDLVKGPNSSILDNIATYSDTTGKTIKDSGINISSDSSYSTLKAENKTLRLTAGPGYGGGYLNMYMGTSGLNVYPTAQGTYPKNLGTQTDIWTNVYAETVYGGNDGLVLFAPSNTSVSLEMDDGSIDFKDRNKNTTAWFDLSGLSDNTSYRYKFPTKPGTLATTQPLDTQSVTLSNNSSGTTIWLDELGGAGIYHMYARCNTSGENTYSDIGTVWISPRDTGSNAAKFQYLGNTIFTRNGTQNTQQYFWLVWQGSTSQDNTAFYLKASTSMPTGSDTSSSPLANTTVYFCKLFEL